VSEVSSLPRSEKGGGGGNQPHFALRREKKGKDKGLQTLEIGNSPPSTRGEKKEAGGPPPNMILYHVQMRKKGEKERVTGRSLIRTHHFLSREKEDGDYTQSFLTKEKEEKGETPKNLVIHGESFILLRKKGGRKKREPLPSDAGIFSVSRKKKTTNLSFSLREGGERRGFSSGNVVLIPTKDVVKKKGPVDWKSVKSLRREAEELCYSSTDAANRKEGRKEQTFQAEGTEINDQATVEEGKESPCFIHFLRKKEKKEGNSFIWVLK